MELVTSAGVVIGSVGYVGLSAEFPSLEGYVVEVRTPEGSLVSTSFLKARSR